MLANEPDGLRNIGIGDRQHIGRLPRYYAQRRNAHLFAWRIFCPTSIDRECEPGFVTGAVRIGNDARERGMGKIAQQLIIVDADDRHLIGHCNSHAATNFQQLLAGQIVAGHDADRFGKLLHPIAELPFLLGHI